MCPNPRRRRASGRTGEDQAPGPPKKRQRPRKKLLPAVPQPGYPAPALIQRAIELLATLRRHDPRLLLSTTDTEHLAPGVAAWLGRDLAPTAVRDALTARLPMEPLHRPAAFLAHRLSAQLPPLPPIPAPGPTPGDPTPAPGLRRLHPRLPCLRARPLPRLP